MITQLINVPLCDLAFELQHAHPKQAQDLRKYLEIAEQDAQSTH